VAGEREAVEIDDSSGGVIGGRVHHGEAFGFEAGSDSGVGVYAEGGGDALEGLSLREIVEQSTTAVEREVLTQVLKNTGGNKAKAARLLKIDYKTIHGKIRQYGIQIDLEERSNSQIEVSKPSIREVFKH